MLIQAAVVQEGSLLWDPAGTLRLAIQRIHEAADEGAELIVFPEAFLGGYPKGLDFGVTVGVRSPAGRAAFRRYFECAVEVPGPEFEELGRAAARRGVHLVMGCVERDGGTLYCTVVFIGPDGAILGKRRKVMPTAMERVVWGQGDGSTLKVIPTRLGRVGAVICWENYMPLLRVAMYQQQVEIYCACTVDDRETWVATMRHIAMEGRCFVLSACQHVHSLIRGGSMVVNPLGRLLNGPIYDESRILISTLDLGQIAEGKFDLDVVGHYSRPDLFSLQVNHQQQQAVRWVESTEPADGD